MQFKFSKYHGCGNDFICIDFRAMELNINRLASVICQRRFSVGADGIVGLFESDVADFKMIIVNSDGSVPEMCGNGLRCFVHYLVDLKEIQSDCVLIETGAGILKAEIIQKNDDELITKISMGKAMYQSDLPLSDFNLQDLSILQHKITIDGVPFEFVPVSMGNPHAVIFVNDVDVLDVSHIGRQVESSMYFPNRVNVEFVQVMDGALKMRVWERGVGETNACGTGACASVVAAILLNKVSNRSISVRLLGGELLIDFDSDSNLVLMQGPSRYVYSSKLEINQN